MKSLNKFAKASFITLSALVLAFGLVSAPKASANTGDHGDSRGDRRDFRSDRGDRRGDRGDRRDNRGDRRDDRGDRRSDRDREGRGDWDWNGGEM